MFNDNLTIYANIEKQNLIRKIKNLTRFGISDLFSNVEIETSSKCNRKCSYCPNSVNNRGNFFMKTELFEKIIDQLAELEFDGIIRPHFYNEPTLDKRLPELIGYAKQKLPKSTVHLYSNGDFMTEELFGRLVNSGVDKFIITSHSGFISHNLQKLLSTEIGKKRIHHQFIGKYTALFNRGGTIEVKNEIHLSHCNIPTVNITINYKGQVVLCCNDALSKNVQGDLNKESVLKIWKKSSFKRLRKNINNGKYELDICKKCVNAR